MSSRRTRTAISLVLALLVPPLFILTIWLNFSGVLSGSLQACFPEARWLGEAALVLWAVSLFFSVGFAIEAIIDKRAGSRGEGIGILVFLAGMIPVLLVVLFFMTFGDPGPSGTYHCPF